MAVVPVIDNVPASTFILASLFKVTTPLNKFEPVKLLMAPSFDTPPPLMLIFASATDILLCNCNAAPETTVVFPVVAPKAPLFRIFITPLNTVISPA